MSLKTYSNPAEFLSIAQPYLEQRETANSLILGVTLRWHALIDTAWEGRPDPDVSSKTPADPDRFRQTLAFVRYCMEYAANLR